MTSRSTGAFGALFLTLLWSPLASSAFSYNADAIEGWVVDRETGNPIEGVVVVAHWQLRGGLEGGTPIRELKILESVTDHDGRYSFPVARRAAGRLPSSYGDDCHASSIGKWAVGAQAQGGCNLGLSN